VSKVIINLPAHSFHLLSDSGREIRMSRCFGALRFLRQHGERRFQAMREIAGRGQRTLHNPLAVLKQRVEIVDQRLQFDRIISAHPAVAAASYVRQSRPQFFERRQGAL